MKKRKTYTCVFVIDEKKRSILLGFKKRGLLEGKWNGFGGKVEPGETILEAASRYVHYLAEYLVFLHLYITVIVCVKYLTLK